MSATAQRVASATRWSEQLRLLRQRAERVPPPPVEGVQTGMVGLTLEAAGCQAAVGDRCEILASGGAAIEAEVVGFSGDRLYLMPTGDIHGLNPNARGVPRLGAVLAVGGEPLVGGVVDGAVAALDRVRA